jgi:predicted nucleic acid-binding protein
MKILIDTNVAVRNFLETDPRHPVIRAGLVRHIDRGHELCVVPQVLYETWTVATKTVPANGLELSTLDAAALIERRVAGFSLVPEPQDMVTRWKALCVAYDVRGTRSHDARIVAAMLGSGMECILTDNAGDFR